MSDKTCEVCGGNVAVIDGTTKHYKNLDIENIHKQHQEIMRIKALLQKTRVDAVIEIGRAKAETLGLKKLREIR